MDDSGERKSHQRSDTYLAIKPHRCYFGGSNRCSCGKHREPATATALVFTSMSTPKERLAFEV